MNEPTLRAVLASLRREEHEGWSWVDAHELDDVLNRPITADEAVTGAGSLPDPIGMLATVLARADLGEPRSYPTYVRMAYHALRALRDMREHPGSVETYGLMDARVVLVSPNGEGEVPVAHVALSGHGADFAPETIRTALEQYGFDEAFQHLPNQWNIEIEPLDQANQTETLLAQGWHPELRVDI